jgi:hypothetical protein
VNLMTPLSLRRLPRVDYDAHPAYGGAFGRPGLGLRVKALTRLAPWMALVLAKRAFLFDRLAVPDYEGPMSGGILRRVAAVPRYVPHIGRALLRTLRHAGARPKPRPEAEGLAERFLRDGLVVARLEGESLARIRAEVARPLDELLRKRDAGKHTFEKNQTWLSEQQAGALYALLRDVLGRHGVLDAAAAYLGRPVRLTHLTLQVNDARDEYHHNKFADIGAPDPPSNYMHTDTSYDMVKCMIYLNEVTDRNGPFCYVPGSARLLGRGFEGLVRRAVDRAGLSGYAPETRRLFLALPAALRRKCTFGSDLPPDSPDAAALVGAEYRFVSRDGDVALFDNLGVHRGSIVHEGERRVLIANLA